MWAQRVGHDVASFTFGRYSKVRKILLLEPSFYKSYNKHFYIVNILCLLTDFPGGSDSRESACNVGDLDLVPGSGRSPGGGRDNPLQCSCLKNPIDRGARWATVHGATKSRTRPSDLHSLMTICFYKTIWLHKSCSALPASCSPHQLKSKSLGLAFRYPGPPLISFKPVYFLPRIWNAFRMPRNPLPAAPWVWFWCLTDGRLKPHRGKMGAVYHPCEPHFPLGAASLLCRKGRWGSGEGACLRHSAGRRGWSPESCWSHGPGCSHPLSSFLTFPAWIQGLSMSPVLPHSTNSQGVLLASVQKALSCCSVGNVLAPLPQNTAAFRWYRWACLQGSHGDADIENRPGDTVWEGEGGATWEEHGNTYTTVCRNRQLVGIRCVMQGAQPWAPQQPRGVRWEGRSGGRGHTCTWGWFTLTYGRNQHDVVEQFSSSIGAFGLWCWRRLLRVPWTARRSNRSILKEISPEYSLEGLMLKLKLQYFGHLMRRTDSLEKTLMLGKI